MKKIKTSLLYFVAVTIIFLIVLLLYPLLVCLCVFKPLVVRGLIIKIANALKLIGWLGEIEKI
jgi:hypothetical protein